VPLRFGSLTPGDAFDKFKMGNLRKQERSRSSKGKETHTQGRKEEITNEQAAPRENTQA
jgi:hypothetical protein